MVIDRNDKQFENEQQELFPGGDSSLGARRPTSAQNDGQELENYDYQERFSLRLSYEILVFSILGAVIFIVAAYVLGYEYGKKSVLNFRKETISPVKLENFQVTAIAPNEDMKESPSFPEPQEQDIEPSVPQNDMSDVSAAQGVRSAYFYAIQVASFKNQATAQTECNRLSQKKISAFILRAKSEQSGTVWYKVYVGQYESSEEALDNKPKMIKEGYKDCLVTKVARSFYQTSLISDGG